MWYNDKNEREGSHLTPYDETLRTLRQQADRLNRLRGMLDELYRERQRLEERERSLAVVRAAEQKDVDRLQGRSLTACFYALLGRREERLDKEQQEAWTAAVRHDAVRRELEAVRQDIASYEREAAALDGCEQRWTQVMDDKRDFLRQSGSVHAERILQLEQQLATQQTLETEIGQALDAGRAARNTAGSILSSLDSAEGWGTFDLFSGGLITDLVKHGHLDDAQDKVETLQTQLRRFKTELTDVSIQADVQAQVDGFLRFADYFFDGLFADWMVLDHIHGTQSQIAETCGQIDDVLSRLRAMQEGCRAAEQRAREALDHLVAGA